MKSRRLKEEKFIAGASAEERPRKKKRTTRGFNLQIPDGPGSLNERLVRYERAFAKRNESQTAIILMGLDLVLRRLEQCATRGCTYEAETLDPNNLHFCSRCGREMFGRSFEDLERRCDDGAEM